MSLNIDMKIIRPLSSDGSLILDMNVWFLLQSCNVVNPGKIFHSNSIGSPTIAFKVLYCDELLNHVNLFVQRVNLTQALDGNLSHSNLPFFESHCRLTQSWLVK